MVTGQEIWDALQKDVGVQTMLTAEVDVLPEGTLTEMRTLVREIMDATPALLAEHLQSLVDPVTLARAQLQLVGAVLRRDYVLRAVSVSPELAVVGEAEKHEAFRAISDSLLAMQKELEAVIGGQEIEKEDADYAQVCTVHDLRDEALAAYEDGTLTVEGLLTLQPAILYCIA